MKSKFDIQRIRELITQDFSSKEIIKEMNISPAQLYRLIKFYNIPNKNRHRNLKVNQFYFETIDSIDKAYFMGLLMADGNIRYELGKMHVRLSLQNKDYEVVEQFRQSLNFQGNIKDYNNQSQLCICSKQLCQDLLDKGFSTFKSNNEKFPDFLSEELQGHFIRGYFDGDGSVYDNPKISWSGSISICGNVYFLERIKTILWENKINSNIRYKNGISELVFSGKRQLSKFYYYLYQSCDVYFMKRKKKKFETILNIDGTEINENQIQELLINQKELIER